jgi:hypothetical protein
MINSDDTNGSNSYSNQTPPRNTLNGSKKHRVGFIVAVCAILVLALSVGAWVLLQNRSKNKNTKAKANNVVTTQPVVEQKALDLPDALGTKLYENGYLGLKLNYPDTWKATSTPDQGVRIESPDFGYTTIAKGVVQGNFKIYIRKGARTIDSKYIGRGVAAAASTQLVYKQPTVGQRKDTLITLFGLDAQDNFAYFFVAGNFNLNVGDTLGPNYGKEPETFIISGGFAGADLTDDMSTNPVALELTNTSNAYKQAIEIIKSIQLS